jgi:hypothetical protein
MDTFARKVSQTEWPTSCGRFSLSQCATMTFVIFNTVPIFAEALKLMAESFPSPLIAEAEGVATCWGNVALFFLNLSPQEAN